MLLPENCNSPAGPSLPPGRHQTSIAAGAKRGLDAAIVASRPDPARELSAWHKAIEHLGAAGLPAAVPELAARQLRRHGALAAWSYTSRGSA
jgi:hypothetical protein